MRPVVRFPLGIPWPVVPALILLHAIGFFPGCTPMDHNAEANIALVEQYVSMVENLDHDGMDAMLADDYMGLGPSVGDSATKATAVANWKANVESLYEKIDYNRSRSIAVTVPDGPNQGEWVSNWAELDIVFKDGGEARVFANTLYKIENDKIVRTFTLYNEADVLEQLGYTFVPAN